MEVYIVRHTRVNVAKDVCYGQSDVGLANTFAEEAALLMAKLPTKFDCVYSSPLSRCLQLAHQFSDAVVQDAALLEMNFGDWEMKKWNDIDQKALNAWMADFVQVCPDNGENLSMLYDRTKTFMDTLRNTQHERVLIIAHAGFIRCVWAYILDVPLENLFKISVDYGELLKVKLSCQKNMDSIVFKG